VDDYKALAGKKQMLPNNVGSPDPTPEFERDVYEAAPRRRFVHISLKFRSGQKDLLGAK